MKLSKIKDRVSAKFSSFLRREDGSIAVEGAMVLSVLSISFVGLADVGVAAYKHAQINSSLRSASQHILNDGMNTQLVEDLFRLNYTDPNATFSSKLICRCARERTIAAGGTVDPNAAPPAPPKSEEITVVQQNGEWSQCSLACGDQAIVKYLGFDATAIVKSLIKPKDTPISASIYVRVE